ncbi:MULTISPECIES: peptidylprolyl isomerase [Sphingomonadales]|uniref:peptidylprolyl isomerase n=1 Tax=Edaphosphingomonas haloaromaticamans TaxID=653954 RepID=A0A1S1HIV3_9SPHN|nr:MULTISPECIES: peptidylprolyl isomerase [Sphingomonas]AGH48964.1 cyclophilin type peptidyl-prolyl cis-trans isomerase [Sphingomonas sp. MM-1]OHT21381.1 Peptidyl-prolyl cis-trans isomerase A precursor [Sphingomonas haloaromaticamans]
MPFRFARRLACLFSLAVAATSPAAAPAPGQVLVRLDTSEGPITVAVETKKAPITAANFLRYVDSKRFDDTSFYRAARAKNGSGNGLIQGGINRRMTRAFIPIAHEPTSQTGLRHVDGTLSMARNAPGTAMGEFFITIGPAPTLDAKPGYVGYAAFGHVVSGMNVVRKILAKPTYPGGYTETTKGQSIIDPPRIITARRVR